MVGFIRERLDFRMERRWGRTLTGNFGVICLEVAALTAALRGFLDADADSADNSSFGNSFGNN